MNMSKKEFYRMLVLFLVILFFTAVVITPYEANWLNTPVGMMYLINFGEIGIATLMLLVGIRAGKELQKNAI